jgi:hypothetical protein
MILVLISSHDIIIILLLLLNNNLHSHILSQNARLGTGERGKDGIFKAK